MFDYIVVIIYLLSMLFAGIYAGKNITSLKEFAINKKNYSDKVMVATLFATVIGAGSTLGIVTNVYQYGIVFMLAFYGAAINKLLVAKFIAPKFDLFKEATSIGDIFEKHYGRFGRFLSGSIIVTVSVAFAGQQITAIGFIFEQFLNIPFLWGVIIAYGVVILYAASGGIKAVVLTDVIQFIIIITFVPIMFLGSLHYFDSFSTFVHQIPLNKINPLSNPDVLPRAITMFAIMTFSALDPIFIHRLIMSKDGKQAAYITKITGYLSFPLFTLMGCIGLVAYMINDSLQPNCALPHMISMTLPPVLKGLAISALLAILMSTIDSGVHVLGLSIVQDLILPLSKKQRSHKAQIKIIRFTTLAFGLLSVIVALYFKNIFDIMIFAFSFWGPTILVPFVFLLYKRVFTKQRLLQGIGLGAITVILWNILLKDLTGFDGFIPGMIMNSFFFYVSIKKHTVPFKA